MQSKVILGGLFLALAMSGGYAAEATGAKQPSWLMQKILSFEAMPAFSPPRSILSTQYEGKTVYYVSPACCDIPSELYDESGNLLCYPGGGFAGGDGRCPTFALAQKSLALVWRDTRLSNASAGTPFPKK